MSDERSLATILTTALLLTGAYGCADRWPAPDTRTSDGGVSDGDLADGSPATVAIAARAIEVGASSAAPSGAASTVTRRVARELPRDASPRALDEATARAIAIAIVPRVDATLAIDQPLPNGDAIDDPGDEHAPREALEQHGFAFVVEPGPRPLLMLRDTASTAWATGPLVASLPEEGPATIVRAVDPARLPGELASLRGRSVTLHGAAGGTCTGVVGDLAIMMRFYTPYEIESLHRGWESAAGERMTAEEVTREMWVDYAPPPVLVARLEPSAGACDRMQWGRFSGAPAPMALERTRTSPAVRARALRALRTVPPHRGLERAGARRVVQAWIDPVTRRRFVSAATITEVEECFGGSIWGVFEVDARGRLTRRAFGTDWADVPVHILDLENDGRLEILMPEMLTQGVEGLEPLFDASPMRYTCRC